jgi:protein TonB
MMLLPPREADRMSLLTGDTSGRSAVTALSLMLHLAALAIFTSFAGKLPSAPPDPPAISFLFNVPGEVSAPHVLASVQAPSVPPFALRNSSPVARAVTPAAPAQTLPRTRLAPSSPEVARAAKSPSYRAVPLRPSHAVARAGSAAPGPTLTKSGPTPAEGTAKPAPVPPAMVDDSGVMLRFRNDIQAVVRAAATMPEAAVLQHRSGRAQVRFSYLDGQVGAVELAQTSRSRVLDDAALAAVRRAHYPPPPPPLRGRRLTLLAWIDFALRPASPG